MSTQALIDTCKSEGALLEETGVRSIALFDHEEVGSDSAQV
jgi:aspartyl aminopeptidase